jgi:nucleoside 2-deoxyribosyltransferase
MSKGDAVPSVDLTTGDTNAVGLYKVYAAGGIFTQHELTTNVLIKDAVWRCSNGKYELVLPQSKEMRELNRPDIAAYIRNVDLLHVAKADMFIARFDGLELDAGTVIEFMIAKNLGKPTVILRCDSRRLSGENLDDPYNLMVRNWPRTVEVHIDSLIMYGGLFAEERKALGDSDTFETTIKAEFNTVHKGIDEIARKITDGLEVVGKMKSPFPPEYQEMVYQALRYSPGSGFDQLLTEKGLGEIIQRLRKNGTL